MADTLLDELGNKLKAMYDPDPSTSTSLDNAERTPEKALDRWYMDHCTFMGVFGCSGLEMPPASGVSEMDDKVRSCGMQWQW